MEKILSKFLAGEIKSRELENIIWEKIYKREEGKWKNACRDAAEMRVKFLEKKINTKIENIKEAFVDTSKIKKGVGTTGIELKIGGAITPMGIAGPIKINGEYARGEFYVPTATNEAALIAGLQRGISAANESGGVKTFVKFDGMTRAPAIECPDLGYANKLIEAIKEKEFYEKIKQAAEKESHVSKLISITPFQIGSIVWLRFVYQTGDSMGMNSATKYTANAVKVILEKFPEAKLVALSGNLCTDKKSAHSNILLGRGKAVQAEVIIKKEILEKKFKGVNAKAIEKINLIKNYMGSALSGSVSGFNANVANTIAAIFCATGQDLAQVAESSSAFDYAEALANGDLKFSVYFPNLEVGAYGGGMNFGTAKEALQIMGCLGPGKKAGENARKLAEIIAAAALCQDLNLLATLANKYELGESHVKLARGK